MSNPVVKYLTSAQVGRFIRVGTYTFAGELLALGTGNWTKHAIAAALVGAAETVYRSIVPPKA